MHKVGIVALVGLLAFGLAGCGEEESNNASARMANETETSAPLVAETADASPNAADEAFLAEARLRIGWNGVNTAIPNATDDQLIDAGHKACEILASGTKFNDLRLIDGELPDAQGDHLDTKGIATAAVLNYCAELNVESTFAD